MKKPTTAILVLLAAGLGFGVGHRLGRDATPPSTTATVEQPVRPPRPAREAGNRVAAVLAQPASLDRAAELAALLRGLGPDSIDEARSAVESVPVDVGELPSALFAGWWAQFEPDAAFAWVRARRPFSKLTHSMAIREWSRHDPGAAAQAVAKLQGTELRLAVLRNLAFGWAESRAPGLDDFLLEIANPGEQQMTVEAYMRWKVDNEGPESAIEWAEAVSPETGNLKATAVQRAAKEVARVDPLRAAAFAEKHADEEYGWLVYRFVGRSWAVNDGAAAMAWLETLPSGRERDKGVDVTYRTWLGADRAAALAWMGERPDEAWLAPAITYYAAALAQDDPDAGLKVAATIPDEHSRSAVMVGLMRGWLGRDEPAAQAWIDQAGLSQDMLDRVFAPQPERRPRPSRAR